MRKTCDWSSKPITPTTYELLLAVLEANYPGKVRRGVFVMPVAVEKVTIRRCKKAKP